VNWKTPVGQNVIVIYDSTSPTDSGFASSLVALLQTDLSTVPGVSGVKTSFIAQLVPQTSVPTTFTAAYKLDGNPIILCPGTSIGIYPATGASAAQLGQEQNLANQQAALIGIGTSTYLGIFDDLAATSHSLWLHSSEQAPSQIGWGASATGTDTSVQVFTTGNSVWSEPYTYTGFPSTGIIVAINTVSAAETEVSSGGTITNGALLAKDSAGVSYYPVARQGRFLQYGLDSVPDTTAGKVFFQNLTALITASRSGGSRGFILVEQRF
jgi:hypothetical protein